MAFSLYMCAILLLNASHHMIGLMTYTYPDACSLEGTKLDYALDHADSSATHLGIGLMGLF